MSEIKSDMSDIKGGSPAGRWKADPADPARPNLVLREDGEIVMVTEDGEIVMVTATAGRQGQLARRNALLAAAAPDLLDCVQRCYARSNVELLGLRGELRGAAADEEPFLRDRLADEQKHAEYLHSVIAHALGVS